MGSEADAVVAVISRILRSETEITAEVTPSAHLLRDLEMDSLALTVLAVGLEDEYRIKLTEDDSSGVQTVQELAELVVRRTREVHP